MPISVTCNNCGSNIKAPDNAAGKKAKCPRCQGELQIPSTQIAVAPKTIARPVQPAPKQDMVPATIPATELKHYKECPFCSEEIAHTAKICKHCGETLDPTLRAAEEAKRSRRERDSDRGRDSGTKVVVNTVVNNSYDRGFNHTVHLVLDVLTCGAWIPVHLLCWILYECGGMLAWGLAAGVVALFGLIGFFVFAALHWGNQQTPASCNSANRAN